MPAATLTSKGQLTLPKQVRELLKVDTGGTVDFVIGADARSECAPVTSTLATCGACCTRPVDGPSLDEVDKAIERRGSRS